MPAPMPNRGVVVYANEQLVAIELERQTLYDELDNIRKRVVSIDMNLDHLNKMEMRLRQDEDCGG